MGCSRPTTRAGAGAARSSSAATRPPTPTSVPVASAHVGPCPTRSAVRRTPSRARPVRRPENPVQSAGRDRADARRRTARRPRCSPSPAPPCARASPPTSSTRSATRRASSAGGYPSPLNYNGFPKSLCTSVNEVICHGIPDDRALVDGDICNLDVTIYLDGVHGDTNATFLVGDVDEESRRLVDVTRDVPRPGDRGGAAGAAVQRDRPGHPDARGGQRVRRRPQLRRARDRRAVPHRPARAALLRAPAHRGDRGGHDLHHRADDHRRRVGARPLGRRLDGRHRRPPSHGPVRAHPRRHRHGCDVLTRL